MTIVAIDPVQVRGSGRGTKLTVGLMTTLACLACLRVEAGEPVPAMDPEEKGEPKLSLNGQGHYAEIRALGFTKDSRHLFSAGFDKMVRIWELPELAAKDVGIEAKATHSSIRWNAGRGVWGQIYALAIAPEQNRIAIAGAANYAKDDILVLDWQVNRLHAALFAHQDGDRDSIAAVCFSSDGQALAALNLLGEANLWRGDAFQHQKRIPPDSVRYGPQVAALIAKRIKLRRPTVIVGDLWIVPKCEGPDSRGVLEWKLERYSAVDGSWQGEWPTRHHYGVLALAASHKGDYLASSDMANRLFLWDLRHAEPTCLVLPQPKNAPVISLAFSRDGSLLAVGTGGIPGKFAPEIQLWDVQQCKLLGKRDAEGPVHACAISPDGLRLAYSGARGNDICIVRLDDIRVRLDLPKRPTELWLTGGKKIAAVAFDGNAGYRVGYHTGGAESPRVFDPEKVEDLGPLAKTNAVRTPAVRNELFGGWRIDKNASPPVVSHEGQLHGVIAWKSVSQGSVGPHCWIPNAQGRVEAIAIAGGSGSCEIYVYDLTTRGELPLRCSYRFHFGPVASMDVSSDGRYLVSAGHDGMLCYWSLARLRNRETQASCVSAGWGMDLALENGQLVVKAVDEQGPMRLKRVRPGDRLNAIAWGSTDGSGTVDDPARMQAWLAEYSQHGELQLGRADTVAFTMSQGGRERKFQLFRNGWPPVLSVYPMPDGEWIAWTPTGYYACSMNGERLVGWLVSQGEGKLPKFFEAARFHKEFDSPKRIRQLMTGGSEPLLRRPPEIKILSPVLAENREFCTPQEQIEIQAHVKPDGELVPESVVLELDGGGTVKPQAPPQSIPGQPGLAVSFRLPLDKPIVRACVVAQSQPGDARGRSEAFTVRYVAHKPQIHILSPTFQEGRCTVGKSPLVLVAEVQCVGSLGPTRLQCDGQDVEPQKKEELPAVPGSQRCQFTWSVPLAKQFSRLQVIAEAGRWNPVHQETSLVVENSALRPKLAPTVVVARPVLQQGEVTVESAELEVAAQVQSQGTVKLVWLVMDGQQPLAMKPGPGQVWTAIAPLKEATHRVRVEAEDTNGKGTSVPFLVRFVPPAPQFHIVSPDFKGKPEIAVVEELVEITAEVNTKGKFLGKTVLELDGRERLASIAEEPVPVAEGQRRRVTWKLALDRAVVEFQIATEVAPDRWARSSGKYQVQYRVPVPRIRVSRPIVQPNLPIKVDADAETVHLEAQIECLGKLQPLQCFLDGKPVKPALSAADRTAEGYNAWKVTVEVPLSKAEEKQQFRMIAEAGKWNSQQARWECTFLRPPKIIQDPRGPEPEFSITSPKFVDGRCLTDNPVIDLVANITTSGKWGKAELQWFRGAHLLGEEVGAPRLVPGFSDRWERTVKWNLRMDHKGGSFELYAYTDRYEGGFSSAYHTLTCTKPLAARGRLYLLAIGVGQEPGEPPISAADATALKGGVQFADTAAQQLLAALKNRAKMVECVGGGVRTLHQDDPFPIVLINKDASQRKIREALDRFPDVWQARQEKSGYDLAVIYVAAHGLAIHDKFHFVPYDGDATNPDTCIPASKLVEISQVVNPLVVLFDSCQSGGAKKEFSPGTEETGKDLRRTCAVMVAACQHNESAWGDPKNNSRIFTGELSWAIDNAKALRLQANEPLRFSKLFTHLQKAVLERSQEVNGKDNLDKHQHPISNFDGAWPEWAESLSVSMPGP